MRRIEFLNATANEIDQPIIGQHGRAALLREVSKGLNMPVDDIVPSREKLEYQMKMQEQAQQQQAQLPAPAASQPGAPAIPAAMHPGGTPKGGQEANTVSPR